MTQEVTVRGEAPTKLGLICASVLAASVTLAAAAAPAAAVVIPPPGAEATASARSATNDAGTRTDQGAPTVATSNSVATPDLASARARATVGSTVRSQSQTSAASGTNLSTQASAVASWVADFTTTGANPGTSVGIDFSFTIDGSLRVQNNNSGASLNDIFANVGVTLRALDAAGTSTVFNGSTRLLTEQNDQAPVLNRTGNWTDSARDGDFSFVSCTRFDCTVNVDANFNLNDAFFVDFSQVFAVELVLSTEAFAFAGFEAGADADFFNTVSVSLGTGTPGVTVLQVDGGGPPIGVAEPGTLALMGSGLAGLLLLRRRGRRPKAL